MSSSSCPVITQEGKDDLESFTNALVEGGIDVKNIGTGLTTCPTTGGKRKNMKKQRGGAITTQQLKQMYMFLLAIVAGFVLSGDSLASRSLWDGIEGIYNGQCNTVTNRVFAQWGFGNTLCTMYITLMDHAVKALGMQPLSLTFMTMVVTSIINAPSMANRIVDGTVNTFATIVNNTYPGTITMPRPMIENGNGGQANTMALENEMNVVRTALPSDAQAVFVPQAGIDAVNAARPVNYSANVDLNTILNGGKRTSKRKMKSKKTKKTKKTKKAKKAKKSKKAKKTKKTKKAKISSKAKK
jgi:hypothetical protein